MVYVNYSLKKQFIFLQFSIVDLFVNTKDDVTIYPILHVDVYKCGRFHTLSISTLHLKFTVGI